MGQGVEQDTGYLCDGGYLNAMLFSSWRVALLHRWYDGGIWMPCALVKLKGCLVAQVVRQHHGLRPGRP